MTQDQKNPVVSAFCNIKVKSSSLPAFRLLILRHFITWILFNRPAGTIWIKKNHLPNIAMDPVLAIAAGK
jgi:hypothetical protein